MSPRNKNEQVLDETAATRRPYEGPAVIESATFETLALACGKETANTVCQLFTPPTSAS